MSIVAGSLLLAACAATPTYRASNGRVWDPKLGVWSSPRLVADGEAVPRGGGSYLTGRPYVIGGRTYVPSQDPAGYVAVGTASWYGDAFHGRRTANGEIFDKGSITAAHPTLPLPSYVRVTNLKNGHSMVVRVNDRGPYHGGRVMDVSQRVAEALEFRGEGTAHVRVEYMGRAPLDGSDDRRLIATLRTDGGPAQLNGMPAAAAVMTARSGEDADGAPSAPQPTALDQPDPGTGPDVRPTLLRTRYRRDVVPLPPPRPFTLGDAGTGPSGSRGGSNRLAALIAGPAGMLGYAPDQAPLTLLQREPFQRLAERGTIERRTDQDADR